MCTFRYRWQFCSNLQPRPDGYVIRWVQQAKESIMAYLARRAYFNSRNQWFLTRTHLSIGIVLPFTKRSGLWGARNIIRTFSIELAPVLSLGEASVLAKSLWGFRLPPCPFQHNPSSAVDNQDWPPQIDSRFSNLFSEYGDDHLRPPSHWIFDASRLSILYHTKWRILVWTSGLRDPPWEASDWQWLRGLLETALLHLLAWLRIFEQDSCTTLDD